MKNISFLFALAFTLFMASCQKEEVNPVDPSKPIEELTVSNDFKWSTSQSVIIHVKGLPTLVPVRNVLVIRTPDGSEILKIFHEMSKDVTLDVTLHTVYSELNLKYGALQLTSPIKDGKAEFSLIPSKK
ncbi:MAG: hypothetical protein PWR20_329 [Bacteroidales bacterium]|jgi:hypothetical protein|nr:hypothetical protein [Bacteroidales bacterium]MDN5330014.1 hypothetical protein [Bacteroidales bacterium]